MTPKQLKHISSLLWAELWQAQLARYLGVSDRTVRYWLSGHSPVPDYVEGEIRKEAIRRKVEIEKWLERK